jgi:hypothetical protein
MLPALVHEVRLAEVFVARGFLTAAEMALDDSKRRRQALADAFSRWAFDRMTRQEQELWP